MKTYGLIGFPLSHSFSETYFANKFRQEKINDCIYRNFPIPEIVDLLALVSANPDLKGLNVTIPYKEKVLPFLTSTNDVVKSVGACNCIKIDGQRMSGYNTDTIGFEISLRSQLKPHHKKALILGEGGAAKAVAFVFEKLGLDYLYVVRKGVPGARRVLYQDLADDTIKSHQVIVNSTPLGMYPNPDECPPINYNKLSPQHYLYDLIYNPDKTLFLKRGEEKGASIKNGYEMLLVQAEESWKIWNGDPR